MKTSFSVLVLLLGSIGLMAQPTAITYQGRLNDGPNPASGLYDLRFAVYDAATDGTVVGAFLTNAATLVSNGLFTVTLDFGSGVFTGAERWVEVGVRTNGSGSFATLTPRRPVTSTPYAITAGNVTGPLSATALSGTYSNAVAFSNAANQFAGTFTGNGVGLSNVNAQMLGGLTAGAFWKLTGNNVAPGQFLGSTNEQPVEIRVNGQRALRLEPNTNGAPNVIGGSEANQVGAGVVGAVISGGGATNYFGFPFPNSVWGIFSSVGGGIGNTVLAEASGIGGGSANTIYALANHSVIAGGILNTIQTNAGLSAIGGGFLNVIGEGVYYANIGGGQYNTNAAGLSVIGGGQFNAIQPFGDMSVIGGGWLNAIHSGADQSVIAGGNANRILNGARESFIGGGFANVIQTNSPFSMIAAGTENAVEPGSAWATLAGGAFNRIGTGANFATVGGGRLNWAAGAGSTIAGGEENSAQPNASYATIAGGRDNTTAANESSIGGGTNNAIHSLSTASTIAGGQNNIIRNASPYASVLGGARNSIGTNSDGAVIAGGSFNVIGDVADFSTIGGGRDNRANGFFSTVAGGSGNLLVQGSGSFIGGGGYDGLGYGANVSTGSANVVVGGVNNAASGRHATVGGGAGNIARGNASTVPGGISNTASAYSFAAGNRAKANHQGSFVWADSTNADFVTTASNQFLVRAGGGVGINTTNPTAALEVVGSVKAGGFMDNGLGFMGSFIGNGTSLSNVNASSFGGFGPSNYWRLGGNFISSAPLALGTIDPVPMTVVAGNRRALRLESAARSLFPGFVIAPNLLGGSEANVISNGVVGATIAGGGQVLELAGFPFPSPNIVSDDFGTVGGGFNNAAGNTNSDPVDARAVTIGGGENNRAGSSYATVGGGLNNTIGVNAGHAFIGGGTMNGIDQDSPFSAIGGGNNNRIEFSAVAATVAGGQGNVIADNALASTIAGGGPNSIARNSMAGAIGGGTGNEIDIDTDFATIAGGEFNRVSDQAHHSSVAGGYGNVVGFSVAYGTIGGGRENHLAGGASHMTIGGGINNLAGGAAATVGGGMNNASPGRAATVPGGERNVAGGETSFAAGRRAQALHAGSFVWADSQDLDFGSTGDNQFSIRASGGVRLSGDTPTLSFDSPNTSILFPPSSGGNAPMIHLFASGTGNSPRMILSHSPAYPDYGLQYEDTPDKFHFLSSGSRVMTVDLGNQFVGIRNGSPSAPLDVNGEARATVFTPTSDRAAKEKFETINPQEVLAKLAALPITRWKFKSLPGEHIGPVAQDFHAAFGTGTDDKHIATVDADGVALAAIQGLNRKLEAALMEKEERIERLERALGRLEKLLSSSELEEP